MVPKDNAAINLWVGRPRAFDGAEWCSIAETWDQGVAAPNPVYSCFGLIDLARLG